MTTVRLAPGQTAQASTSIIVGSGETKIISIYAGTNVPIPSGVGLHLQRKNAAGNWQEVYAPEFGHVVFNATLLNVSISSVGEYRVLRYDISAYGVDVGVSED
jgi:hypothetical protein